MKKLKLINNISGGDIYLEDGFIHYISDPDNNPKAVLVSCSDDSKRALRCSEFISLLGGQSYLTGGIKYVDSIDIPQEGESIYDKSFYYRGPRDVNTSSTPRIDINTYPGKESTLELNTTTGEVETSPPLGDIKVCDSWSQRRIEVFKNSIKEIYDNYIGLDKPGEEIFNNIASRYSQDYFEDTYSETIELVSYRNRDYTNRVDLREYIEKSTLPGISGKLDITIEYIKKGTTRVISFSYTAFSYNGNILKNEDRIFETSDIQGEYLNGIFTVYPISPDVTECIISDCILIYGKL
jgi:hypothetical protein